jgi:hypothetical protein
MVLIRTSGANGKPISTWKVALPMYILVFKCAPEIEPKAQVSIRRNESMLKGVSGSTCSSPYIFLVFRDMKPGAASRLKS